MSRTEIDTAYADGYYAGLQHERQKREVLVYWLLRAYQSGHREGWEAGPSTDETMDGILDVLANRGYDPNEDQAAKDLLANGPSCKK